jgi:hypothetical protein
MSDEDISETETSSSGIDLNVSSSWKLTSFVPRSVQLNLPSEIDRSVLQADLADLKGAYEAFVSSGHTPGGAVLATAKSALGEAYAGYLLSTGVSQMSLEGIASALQGELIIVEDLFRFSYARELPATCALTSALVPLAPVLVEIPRLAGESDETLGTRIGYVLGVAETLISMVTTRILLDEAVPDPV